jgi:general secretion pathway protein D
MPARIPLVGVLIPDTIFVMRRWLSVFTIFAMVMAAWADQPPVTPSAVNCANGVPGSPECIVTPKSRSEAKKAFARGMKLQKEKRLDEALREFERAADLVPQDVQYVTLREMVRQQLVFDHVQRGNGALANGSPVEALGEFGTALHFDPSNDFARQRLNDALVNKTSPQRQAPVLVETEDEILVAPRDVLQNFHFRGDSRGLLTQIGSAYGVTVTFDESVVSRRVRFDVENVDFFVAMRLAGAITKTFWSPLQSKQILVATDSTENHRLFDRMGLRTFYIPDMGSQQELTDLVNVLRTVFEVKYVTSNAQSSTITVRAPQNVLYAASQFLEQLGSGHPEVMLDVRIYQISRTVVHNFGLQIPNQFTLYNIPVGALGLTLGGVNIQDLINQLIASGGINQADSTAISALLAQLPSSVSSIFKQPLATFGGGLTLMGVSLGTLGATLSMSDSQVQTLQHVTLRAEQGKDATMNLGSRYPIINASFAPIFNTSAISQALQNNSFIAPVPSFTYEDIGINLKVKPVIHGETDVSLAVELKVRALTGASSNGVPVIGNREYSGSINLKNEQSAVVAGQLTESDTHSLSGIPGVGQVPALSPVVNSNSKQKDESEMLVVITPHIISIANTPESEIWMTGVK